MIANNLGFFEVRRKEGITCLLHTDCETGIHKFTEIKNKNLPKGMYFNPETREVISEQTLLQIMAFHYRVKEELG